MYKEEQNTAGFPTEKANHFQSSFFAGSFILNLASICTLIIDQLGKLRQNLSPNHV